MASRPGWKSSTRPARKPMTFLINAGIAIGALLLLGLAAWLGVQWQAIQARVRLAQSRLKTLMAAYEDAERLAAARTRFRRRQKAVEGALATGTTGLESAHRSLAGRMGSAYAGEPFYARVRRFNSQVGRSVSALLAPKSRRHSESLDEWRQRVEQADAEAGPSDGPSSDALDGSKRSRD